MPENKNHLILVDGSAYLFRAYHALPPLTNSKNMPTGAVFGVVNMLRGLLERYPESYFAVVFDTKEPTFRHQLYPEYKANREEMPEELAEQIAPLFEIIEAGLPLLKAPGYEADDLIGTLSVNATKAGFETLISSGDKDLAQLVNDHVTLVDTMRNRTLDPQGVKEKFEVMPNQIVDLLALTGDSVDNIPGIPKVGPKTAAKWLNQYGDIDTLLEHAEEIKGKVGEYLRAHQSQLPLGKQLTSICLNVPKMPDLASLKRTPANNEKLLTLFQELEFKRWTKEQEALLQEAKGIEKKSIKFEVITTLPQLDAIITEIKKEKIFAFDTETTSLCPISAELVGVSLATQKQTVYIPLQHKDPAIQNKQLKIEQVIPDLKEILQDTTLTKIAHNLKYDMNVLKKYNVTVSLPIYDTMLASYVYHSTATHHDLDSLALKYLNHTNITYEEIAGKGAKQIPFDEVPLEIAAPYAAEDAWAAFELYRFFKEALEATPKLNQVFTEIELPLVPILAEIEYTGVLIDPDLLKKQSSALEKKIKHFSQAAHDEVGEAFNLDSPKQLQEILYQKLKLPILAKTPKGQPSTAENVLAELAHDYPLPQMILEYRSLSKLKNTYTDKLPLCIHPSDARIHASFHQAVTATGRLSSSDPNLQNIPIKTPAGRAVRQAFIAPENAMIVSADYSQIELRLMAHLSGDPALIAAFQHDEDIHQFTASEIFGTDIKLVTHEQRRQAKAINFGLIYGMSAFGLAKQLHIPRSDASAYIETYFKRYPKVKAHMEAMKALAGKQGFVETLFGRRLYINEIHSKNAARRHAAERIAINAPLQGSASDLIKKAMIQVNHALNEKQLAAKIILQVHDELVFEVQQASLTDSLPIIKNAMENAAKLSIPLKVHIQHGKNWEAAH